MNCRIRTALPVVGFQNIPIAYNAPRYPAKISLFDRGDPAFLPEKYMAEAASNPPERLISQRSMYFSGKSVKAATPLIIPRRTLLVVKLNQK